MQSSTPAARSRARRRGERDEHAKEEGQAEGQAVDEGAGARAGAPARSSTPEPPAAARRREGAAMSPREQTTAEVTRARCRGTRWAPVPYIPLSARGLAGGPPRDLREPAVYRC